MARNVIYPTIGPGGAAVAVRLPKGERTLTPRLANAIDNMGQRISTLPGCTIVFFKNRAVQRCENRKLSTSAMKRWKAMRGKKVCHAKSGAKKGKFIRCR